MELEKGAPTDVVKGEIMSIMISGKPQLRTIHGIVELLANRVKVESIATAITDLICDNYLSEAGGGVVMLGSVGYDLTEYDPFYFISEIRMGNLKNERQAVAKRRLTEDGLLVQAEAKKATKMKAGKVKAKRLSLKLVQVEATAITDSERKGSTGAPIKKEAARDSSKDKISTANTRKDNNVAVITPKKVKKSGRGPQKRYSSSHIKKAVKALDQLIKSPPADSLTARDVVSRVKDKIIAAKKKNHSLGSITKALNKSGIIISSRTVSKVISGQELSK